MSAPPPLLQAALFTCWIVTKPIEVAGETLAGRSDALPRWPDNTLTQKQRGFLSFFLYSTQPLKSKSDFTPDLTAYFRPLFD